MLDVTLGVGAGRAWRAAALRVVLALAWLGGASAGVAAAQDLSRRPGPQEMPVAITHARVHPVSGPVIEDGYVLFEGGVIREVGSMGEGRAFIATTRVIEARGKRVYPGLIGAYSQLGLTEIGAVRATRDFDEVGSITPEVVAAVAVNPDSTLLPVARTDGVLVSGVFPTGGLMPGRASVMRWEGWTWEAMAVKREAGVVIAWPLMRTVTAWWMDKSESEQRREIRERVGRIEGALDEAEAYLGARARDAENTPLDVRWEALRASLTGERSGRAPVFIEAQDYDQITAAAAFGARRGLKVVIVGGREAVLCAPLLKAHDVAVIVRGTHELPGRDDAPVDELFTLPSRLEAAGLRWCLASGEEPGHERLLAFNAASSVAHGLSAEAALRSVTLSAAEILGVGEVLGSLEPGKEATLLVTDGDIFETMTRVEMAFIQGKDVPLSNKQSDLAAKYREKYAQQGVGDGGAGPAERPTRK